MDYVSHFRRAVRAFEAAARQATAQATGQPASGQPASGQPASGQPASARQASGRQASGRPASGRPALGRGGTPLVPSCPGWSVADLVIHLGAVHRHVAAVIEDRRPGLPDPADLAVLGLPADTSGWPRPENAPNTGPMPTAVLDWFAEGAARLGTVFAAATPGDPAWTWSTEQTVGFWQRMQAIEAAIHRWDAENALYTTLQNDSGLATNAATHTARPYGSELATDAATVTPRPYDPELGADAATHAARPSDPELGADAATVTTRPYDPEFPADAATLAVRPYDPKLGVDAVTLAPRPFDPEFAADAVTQVFEVMAPARRAWTQAPAGAGERFLFRRTDGPEVWAVRFEGDEVLLTEDVHGAVELAGTASDLLLHLWHRLPADRLDVRGDKALLDRYFTLVPPV